MNLTLHHFIKDFRYLWLRWCGLLLAICFDLALQMQWVFPISQESNIMLPSFFLSLPMWIIACWFMLCVPPEDRDAAFHGTRPLSRRDYWQARLMTGVLLMMLPLILENAAFLLLSGRGWVDLRSGMLETGLAAAVMLLWLLPAAALFRDWEKYVALVLFIYGLGGSLSTSIFEGLGLAYRGEEQRFYDSSTMLISGGCLLPLIFICAYWHAHRPFGKFVRLGLPLIMGLLLSALAQSMLIPSRLERPHDQALVDKLVKDRQLVIDHHKISVLTSTENKHQLVAQIPLNGLPPEIVPHWHVVRHKMNQKGQPLPDVEKISLKTKAAVWELNRVTFNQSLVPYLPAAWPSDTLAVMEEPAQETNLATVDIKTDTHTPITLDLDLSAEWMRLRELGRMPLKPGANICTQDSEIEVMEVIAGFDNQGHKDPAAITLKLLERHTTFAGRNKMLPISSRLCLLGKDKRLLWHQVMDGATQERGANQGWVTISRTVTFLHGVLIPGSGVTSENLAEQELVWIGGEYLGTSRHEVKVENFVLSDHIHDLDIWPRTKVAVESGYPHEAFLKHVKGIPRPQKGASKDEAARFVATVCSASLAFSNRYNIDKFNQQRWLDNEREVAALLAPVIIEHPEIISAIVASMPFNEGTLKKRIVSEVLFEAKIPGFFMRVLEATAQGGEQHTNQEPWISSFEQDWSKISTAIIQALKTHSDEPLRPLMEREENTSETTENIWEKFCRKPFLYMDDWDLKRLLLDPFYRDKAKIIVDQEYLKIPRAALFRREKSFSIIACKSLLGDIKALDLALRIFGLFDDANLSHEGAIQNFHSSVFGESIQRADTAAFIKNCRTWSAHDFRYDPEKLQWKLNTTSKP